MRQLFAISFTFLMLACGNQKAAVNESATSTGTTHTEEITQEENENTVQETSTMDNRDVNRVVGIVHVSDECPLWIEEVGSGNEFNFYPVNLDEMYQKEGMRIRFSYAQSKAPSPANCKINMVVSVDNVTRLR